VPPQEAESSRSAICAGETNRLLGDLNRRVDKLCGGGQAAFG